MGPYGINHPTTRIYEPGTNVLETTWKTPTGWIVVRDALTLGPRTHDDEITPHVRPPSDDLLALDEALTRLAALNPVRAELVKLRFFAGLTTAQAAGVLGISPSTADNDWAYARCWLRLEIDGRTAGEQP